MDHASSLSRYKALHKADTGLGQSSQQAAQYHAVSILSITFPKPGVSIRRLSDCRVMNPPLYFRVVTTLSPPDCIQVYATECSYTMTAKQSNHSNINYQENRF